MTSVDMEPKRQFVLSLLVSNHFGVLTRISGLLHGADSISTA